MWDDGTGCSRMRRPYRRGQVRGRGSSPPANASPLPMTGGWQRRPPCTGTDLGSRGEDRGPRPRGQNLRPEPCNPVPTLHPFPGPEPGPGCPGSIHHSSPRFPGFLYRPGPGRGSQPKPEREGAPAARAVATAGDHTVGAHAMADRDGPEWAFAHQSMSAPRVSRKPPQKVFPSGAMLLFQLAHSMEEPIGGGLSVHRAGLVG